MTVTYEPAAPKGMTSKEHAVWLEVYAREFGKVYHAVVKRAYGIDDFMHDTIAIADRVEASGFWIPIRTGAAILADRALYHFRHPQPQVLTAEEAEGITMGLQPDGSYIYRLASYGQI